LREERRTPRAWGFRRSRPPSASPAFEDEYDSALKELIEKKARGALHILAAAS
jgi:hypothetical protein